MPNALCALASWGHSCSFVGVVGDDVEGSRFRQDISTYGVDPEFLLVREQEATPRAFLWVEKTSGRRTIVLDRDIAPLSSSELPLPLLQSSRFLLIDGVEADATIQAAKAIRAMGGQVMLDAGNVRDRMEEQIALTDWLVVPIAFIRNWFGGVDLFQAARDLRELGPRGVVITNGAAGSVAAWGQEVQWFQAYSVKSVDTTGAGDLFHAGFLHGVSQGWDVPDCIRWASAAGGLATIALGGRGHLPTKDEVERLLRDAGDELDVWKGSDG
ncbi:sugar kinase [bacterium]|nr:sugar kinase [bacterium]